MVLSDAPKQHNDTLYWITHTLKSSWTEPLACIFARIFVVPYTNTGCPSIAERITVRACSSSSTIAWMVIVSFVYRQPVHRPESCRALSMAWASSHRLLEEISKSGMSKSIVMVFIAPCIYHILLKYPIETRGGTYPFRLYRNRWRSASTDPFAEGTWRCRTACHKSGSKQRSAEYAHLWFAYGPALWKALSFDFVIGYFAKWKGKSRCKCEV